MLKQKNEEKELRMQLKYSYAQVKEMDQQLRQLKSKYDDVNKKLQQARRAQGTASILHSESDQPLSKKLESDAWQSHRLKTAIGQVQRQRQTSSGNRSNDSENMSSILRHEQPRKTIAVTGRLEKQIHKNSMTDTKRFQSANGGLRQQNQTVPSLKIQPFP